MINFKGLFFLIAIFISLLGCASTEKGLISSSVDGWATYSRCSNTGYFRDIEGFQETIYVNTTDREKKDYWLYWYFQGSGELKVRFRKDNPNVIVSKASSEKQNEFKINFIVDQKITEKHPDVPNGMIVKYDSNRNVAVYGKRNPWKGGLKQKGDLRVPFYIKRIEKPPAIDGSPSKGYKRNHMKAAIQLGDLGFVKTETDSLKIEMPSYIINGRNVQSKSFHFNYTQRSAYRSKNCIYWQAGFPGFFQKLFYKLNPF